MGPGRQSELTFMQASFKELLWKLERGAQREVFSGRSWKCHVPCALRRALAAAFEFKGGPGKSFARRAYRKNGLGLKMTWYGLFLTSMNL